MEQREYFVYILANKRNGTLYIGVTNDLIRRTEEHRSGMGSRFTSKYDVGTLVYLERHNSSLEAITREKQLKKWRRAWKVRLIEEMNPD